MSLTAGVQFKFTTVLNPDCSPFYVIGVCHNQPNSIQKAQPRKKAHKALCTLCISQSNVSAMFNDNQILLFLLYNKQTFSILSLRDLLFVFSSLEVNILRVQRIISFFVLFTHKSTRWEDPIRWLFQTIWLLCSAFLVFLKFV